MERVVIFIDGSNFYHGLRKYLNIGSVKLDFLAKILCERRVHIATRYYTAPLRQYEDPIGYTNQQRYLQHLRNTPKVDVILGRFSKRAHKEIICQNCKKRVKPRMACPLCKAIISARSQEKGVDVKLAVDMLSLAHKDKYDIAILISEDGDFVKAVEAVRELGKQVENAYFKSRAVHLKSSCSTYVILTRDLLAPCLI